jgi:hypothetical protein
MLRPAPPVLEFDQEGNLLRHWGGPGAGYDWPFSNHGITINHKGNVWIGGNSREPTPGSDAPTGGFQSFHDDIGLEIHPARQIHLSNRQAWSKQRQQ